jgi:hypothetical protein
LGSYDCRKTPESVDRYARAKQAEGSLSNNSVNKTLSTLSAILELAVDWERIPRNPAKGKRRRLRGEPRKRLHLEPPSSSPPFWRLLMMRCGR